MKQTVKISYLIIIVMILMAAIVSCQSSETSNSDQNKFVGVWINYDSSLTSTTRAVVTIFGDGTFKYEYYVGGYIMIDEVGTYSIDGNELITKFYGGKIVDEHYVYVLSGDTPYIKDSVGKRYGKES